MLNPLFLKAIDRKPIENCSPVNGPLGKTCQTDWANLAATTSMPAKENGFVVEALCFSARLLGIRTKLLFAERIQSFMLHAGLVEQVLLLVTQGLEA